MTIAIGDLVARFRADTSDIERGGQVAKQTLRAVADEANVTTRALEIMAQAASKANPGQGSPSQILEFFQRANVQPTTAALSQARAEMEKVAAAASQAIAPIQAVARAARDHAAATTTGARAVQNVADGWKLSESSLVRFGAGLVGINLGISLIAGAARLVHDAIEGIVDRQLDWERSLRTLSGLYGQTGAQAAAVANAQANLPGVLGTQQEFAQAAINASGLRLRYGISQDVIDQLTTTGGRIAYATGMTDVAQRAQLQTQILAAVQTGAPLPPQYGVYTDPEAVARRLGFQGAQSLQAFTPQELIQARAAIVTEGGTRFVDQAGANQRAALDIATRAEKAVEQAQTAIQQNIESPAAGTVQGPTAAERRQTQSILEYGRPTEEPPQATPYEVQPSADLRGLAAIDAERNVLQANEQYVRALADSTKAQDNARKTIDDLAHSVDAAGAQVIKFFGSLEDATSISHGDILAQAQSAVTARARSAVPVLGMSNPEIGAIARGTTSAQVWQNYVAELAQTEATDAIRKNLTMLANQEGPGLEPQRNAAQRALASAPQLDVINRRLSEADKAAALADLQISETQSRLEQITLTQRERGLQLLRETVDVRKLDVQQQQVGLAATMEVMRAQQRALPSQYALADANYATQRAQAIALQRMGRVLQGKDVSDLPSPDELIRMQQQGQFAAAEAGPSALQGGRAIELAQRTATSAGLAEQLTAGQLRSADLANDLKNLGDLPSQTALELELVQNNRDQLGIAKEQRDLMKDLVRIMTGRSPSATGGQGVQDIANRIAQELFGDDGSDPPAPPEMPANRRGPF